MPQLNETQQKIYDGLIARPPVRREADGRTRRHHGTPAANMFWIGVDFPERERNLVVRDSAAYGAFLAGKDSRQRSVIHNAVKDRRI